MHLKVRGSWWCCHSYGTTVQMTHHADNLKIPFLPSAVLLIWYLHFLLLCYVPKVKVSGHACVSLCVCDSGYENFFCAQTVLAEVTGFCFEVARINFSVHTCKEGNVPYQYHSSSQWFHTGKMVGRNIITTVPHLSLCGGIKGHQTIYEK